MQWWWPDPLLLQDKDQAEHSSRNKTWNCDDDGGDDDHDESNYNDDHDETFDHRHKLLSVIDIIKSYYNSKFHPVDDSLWFMTHFTFTFISTSHSEGGWVEYEM